MTVRTGTGCSLAMGTTNYDVEILSANFSGQEVPVVDTSHLGTTGTRTKVMADLKEPGTLEVEFHVDPDKLDTLNTAIGLAQTMTFTFKKVSGEATAATLAGSGAISAHNFTIPLEDKCVGNYTISWLGAVTPTDAS